jgi:hypothetical protein
MKNDTGAGYRRRVDGDDSAAGAYGLSGKGGKDGKGGKERLNRDGD